MRGKLGTFICVWTVLMAAAPFAFPRDNQGSTPPPQTGIESPDTNPGEATSQASISAGTSNFWTSTLITPQVSIVYPIKLTLVDSAYRVPFSQEFAGIPLFSAALAKSLGTRGDFQFFGVGQLGFATRSGLVSYVHLADGVRGQDRMQVAWMPVTAALKTVYRIPGMDFVKPFLSLGGGVQWLHESARHLTALNNDFLVPFYVITPGFAFLEGKSTDWFGGFNFSVSYSGSFESNQDLQGLGFDLSLNILL